MPVIPSRTPRDRVVDHLRTALSVGVASVMVTGCTSCIVSDPLPQPSACSVGPVSSSVATVLKRVGSELTLELILSGRLQAVGPVTASGATLSGQVQVAPDLVRVTLQPTSSDPIEVTLPVSCAGVNSKVGVRLRPTQRPDAGSADGGSSTDGGLPEDYAIEVFDK
jgi:hypothetical protein